MKISNRTLKKLEGEVEALNFKLRYEKGHFKSGFCIVKDQKVVIINKFYSLRDKIENLNTVLTEIS